ncbi:MAG: FAD-dependent oxidoreductase [Rhodoferax sp.]
MACTLDLDPGDGTRLWQALQDAARAADAPPHHVLWAAQGAWAWAQQLRCPAHAAWRPAWEALRRRLARLHGPGWHRLALPGLDAGITVGIGDLAPLLAQARLQAQQVYLPACLDDAHAAPLARLCQRGARIWGLEGERLQRSAWRSQGFVAGADGQPPAIRWDPPWPQQHGRAAWRHWWSVPQRCAVVGAGLAGAAVAQALARRGWQVQVLDRSAHPAQGASGLPVGLAAPLASADDNALSQLSRAGVRLLHAHCEALLRSGQDWSPSGAWDLGPPLRWQSDACWVRPAALVQAWLATPGVQWLPGADVAALEHDGQSWCLRSTQGQVLARAERVVLANAHGGQSLARTAVAARGWPALHAVRGLVSSALQSRAPDAPYPGVPWHGNGSLVCHVPSAQGPRWYVGASYQPVHPGQAEWPDDKNHGANALRLQRLAPALLEALAPSLERDGLEAWKGERCVSADRLPLLGCADAAQPGLWVCAAFGSRGLSLAALCAELLAAQWNGEPWPLDARLAQALLPQRRLGEAPRC